MPFEHIFIRVGFLVVRNGKIAAGKYQPNLRQLGEHAVRRRVVDVHL